MLKQLALFFVCLTILGCKQEQNLPKDFDYGSHRNGVYTNDYFGMRFAFDDSWNVQSMEEMSDISALGQDLILDEKTRNNVKANDVKNANLFSAFRYEMGSIPDYNYSIAIVAENIQMFPKVKRGRDYLIQAKKLMELTEIDYTFDDDFSTRTIGGKDFDVLSVTGEYNGGIFKQQYSTVIYRGFSISIIISYATEAQLQELNALIDKISFTEGASKKKQ